MGLGREAMEVYARLRFDKQFACNNLDPGNSVIELGSQDMNTGDEWYGKPAREWYEKELRMDYSCIDLDGRHGALKMDLNMTSVEQVWGRFGYCKQFDLVTNHGTSEHCFDQCNVFRLMHHLCKVGGIMLHIVPHTGFPPDHCFYYYSPTLFMDLQRANGYERVMLGKIDGVQSDRPLALAVFRKTRQMTQAAEDFVLPLQRTYRLEA